MPAADGAGILNWVLLSCDEVDDDGDTIPFWLEPKEDVRWKEGEL